MTEELLQGYPSKTLIMSLLFQNESLKNEVFFSILQLF